MTATEIREAINDLAYLTTCLQNLYVDNEGEVTAETESLETRLEEIKGLLTDGVDDLGRWLRLKEDEAKAAKAEKDYAARRQKAAEGSVAFIKSLIREVFDATGQSEARGSLGYKFSSYDSVTTSADKELIQARYWEQAEKAFRDAGIPEYITFTLGASISLAKDGEVPDVFHIERKPTVKFTKPRAGKEE